MINSLINKAHKYSELKHEKQIDDNGKPHYLHSIKVASILSLITDNTNVIAAGYLHDILEDTDTTFEELKNDFNEEIASLVHEVTHEGTKDSKGYYFPWLKSRNAFLIKFADRLDNLSRMENWELDRKNQYMKKSKFWAES